MQSVLLIPVPAAEPVVSRHRQELDLAARDGIGAHVTVLYPFVEVEAITPEHDSLVDEVLQEFEPFTFTLDSVGWFGDAVVYLRPRDPAAFHAITNAIVEAFPEHPPYEGAFDEIVPHLTIGDSGTADRLRQAAADVEQHLPIEARATKVQWLYGDIGSQWKVRRTISLSGRQSMPLL